MSKVVKLKNLVEEVFEETQIDEKAFLNDVANYSSIGKRIYRDGSIYEVAKKLSELARIANIHTVRETEEEFDKITVNRNMKELNSYSKEFNKVAQDAHGLQQRMEGLYEDMGRVLNRYYNINETYDSVTESVQLNERSKFDEKRMTKLVQKDKFLKYVVKKEFRGNADSKNLEKIYDDYVEGDRDMEKAYKRI